MKIKYILIIGIAIVVGLLVSFSYFRTSPIIKITSFSEINFNVIQQNSLVCFDVDETLVAPEDSFVALQYMPQGRKFEKEAMLRYPEVRDWNKLQSIILQEAKRPLIEKNVVFMIDSLQQRGVPVIAFTAMNTGSLGLIDRLEDWRYKHLKSLGIEGSFEDKEFVFDYKDRHPIFYKGLLCADLVSKGNVLGMFLDAIHYKPSIIIMIDDNFDYLKSVEKECLHRKIAFKGYYYCGYQEPQWNSEIIDYQVDYLIKNKHWLPDLEVYDLLKKLNLVAV